MTWRCDHQPKGSIRTEPSWHASEEEADAHAAVLVRSGVLRQWVVVWDDGEMTTGGNA